jgi:hypothetical protein
LSVTSRRRVTTRRESESRCVMHGGCLRQTHSVSSRITHRRAMPVLHHVASTATNVIPLGRNGYAMNISRQASSCNEPVLSEKGWCLSFK